MKHKAIETGNGMDPLRSSGNCRTRVNLALTLSVALAATLAATGIVSCTHDGGRARAGERAEDTELPGSSLARIPSEEKRQALEAVFRALPEGEWTVETRKVTVAVPELKIEERWIAYFKPKGLDMEFVYVPPGTFMMGSPPDEEGREDDEGPQHRVEITEGFLMSATEVTNAQYRRYFPSHDSKNVVDLSLNGDAQPVVWVTWEDAVSFCEKLDEELGPRLRCGLPTEAQWEYACRAGTTTARPWGKAGYGDGKVGNLFDLAARRHWWGQDWPSLEVNDGHAVAAPVGSYYANGWGLYDMIGNAAEWCADRYGEHYYARSPAKDPKGPEMGDDRVVRGGSWCYGPGEYRSAARGVGSLQTASDAAGFRVVVSLP